MPAPVALAPFAWKAAQFGAVAAVAWYAARRRKPAGLREVWRERVLDEVEYGVETDFSRTTDETYLGASGKWRRTVRLGTNGPGIEIDATGLTRIRLRRASRQ